MAIAVGTKAPDFSLKSKTAAGLTDVKLSENFGKKNTVLLFFPLAFTSVCTQEMCDITGGLNENPAVNLGRKLNHLPPLPLTSRPRRSAARG